MVTSAAHGVDPRRLELWYLFLQVHARSIATLGVAMQVQNELPLPWFDVLLQLSFGPDGQLRMVDLLRHLVLSRSGLTRRITRMVEAGLVARADCAEDARGVVVTLTPIGKQRLRAAVPGHLMRMSDVFARHFSDDEVRQFTAAFTRVLDANSDLVMSGNLVSS